MTDKTEEKPQKIKGSIEELEVLTKLKASLEWVIFKRIANRYVENLRKYTFKMDETDPKFPVLHARYAGEALGLKKIVRIVEKADELDEKEGEKNAKS